MRNAMAKKTAGLNIFRRTQDEERCEMLWDSRLQGSRRNAIGNRRKKLERVVEIDALDIGYVKGLSCASSQWSLV